LGPNREGEGRGKAEAQTGAPDTQQQHTLVGGEGGGKGRIFRVSQDEGEAFWLLF